MSDEDALLAGVAADPAALPRLMYADWLDDHDQADRAELVRLEQHLTDHPADGVALVRFRTLAAGCDPAWLARVVRPAVTACGLRFAVSCAKQWAELTPTADPTVRHCDGCSRPVRLVITPEQALTARIFDECAAVDARLLAPNQSLNRLQVVGLLAPPVATGRSPE